MYRNGKAEYYDVLHPNLVDAYKGIGEDAMDFGPLISGPGNFFTKYSRVASRAITYSPPFVAFNAIRDTLAGTITQHLVYQVDHYLKKLDTCQDILQQKDIKKRSFQLNSIKKHY